MATPVKRILIYRLGSLGDTVIALPVFNKIRETYPNAEITLLTNKPIVDKAAPLQSVLGDSFFFNSILNYPIGTRNPALLFELILQIRALHIDIVIYLASVRILNTKFKTRLTAHRDKLFFKASGAKKIIGFPSVESDYSVIIDGNTGIYEWEARRLARRFRVLGDIPLDDDKYWDLRLTDQEQQAAKQAINELDITKPILAVSTGTKNQTNDWEELNWLNLFERLSDVLSHWQLVLLGGPDEAERAEKCLAFWQSKGVNLCGKTSPRVSGAVLKHTQLFIGHDSGPMHLAAGVGVPCVAIFSARNLPGKWFPRGSNNTILYHKTDCAGCELNVCIVQKKKCILSITVAEVYNAVVKAAASVPINEIDK
jgi:ADP-heptose:LPS heptosyltransferase